MSVARRLGSLDLMQLNNHTDELDKLHDDSFSSMVKFRTYTLFYILKLLLLFKWLLFKLVIIINLTIINVKY